MYPYTQNVGSLIGVIKAIGSHGVPDKFTTKELPVWGYKSSNDRSIVSVLKHIGFIDQSERLNSYGAMRAPTQPLQPQREPKQVTPSFSKHSQMLIEKMPRLLPISSRQRRQLAI